MAGTKLTIESSGDGGAFIDGLVARFTAGEVKAGFLAGATYPATGKQGPLPVATVALWNEFGTSHAPARPFMRNTIAEKSKYWGEVAAKAAALPGATTERVLGLVGTVMKDNFVTAIVKWPADNAPYTVARKGFNKGLIHTGLMQRSVDYAVEK